uniref:Uncharacterized protein n=1 Tax=Kalanchoe fedtschenkoi TaxID=63787 RepID=A0A7N0U8U3_KALFE
MLSFSCPSSATSSPRHKSCIPRKERSALRRNNPTGNTKYSNTQPQLQLQLSRSKSCGEGRASTPSVDEFELCFNKGETHPPPDGAISKADSLGEANNTPQKSISVTTKNNGHTQDFKCGALCVYLPSFSKPKATKTPNQRNEAEPAEAAVVVETPHDLEDDIFLSKRISMAKFQWGSRSSAAIVSEGDHHRDTDHTESPEYKEGECEDSMNLYFDLPLELIRCTVTDSPEKAAFVFTGYQGHGKTFSKNSSSDPLISSAREDSCAGQQVDSSAE